MTDRAALDGIEITPEMISLGALALERFLGSALENSLYTAQEVAEAVLESSIRNFAHGTARP